MKKLFLYIFLAMFVMSCEQDIDIRVENFESQMVLNSLFSPDKTWSVEITNSANILDPQSQIEGITDASVNIIETESLKIFPLDHIADGIYYANTFPEIGLEYELEVAHPDYGVARGIAEVPSNIEVVEIDTSFITVDGVMGLKVDFNIVDNADEENFYVWDLLVSEDESPSILPTQEAYLTSVDGNVEITTDRSNVQQSKLFISDSNFNGLEYNTSFISYQNVEEISQNVQNPGSNDLVLQLRIMTVSKDLFEYLKDVEQFYRSQNINTSSVHPVDIDSNVEGGLGIFGAYHEKIITIE